VKTSRTLGNGIMQNGSFSKAAQATTAIEALRPIITRENALQLLRNTACLHCGTHGSFSRFVNENCNGTGIRCKACGKHHPFGGRLPLWLRSDSKQPSAPIDLTIIDSMEPEQLEQWLRTDNLRQAVAWADGDAGRLTTIARLRGYQAGWIHHVLRTHREKSMNPEAQ
jgi:hypothetical protein